MDRSLMIGHETNPRSHTAGTSGFGRYFTMRLLGWRYPLPVRYVDTACFHTGPYSIQKTKCRNYLATLLVTVIFFFFGAGAPMANELMLIDGSRTDQLESELGSQWRIVTDGVMGGVSSGNIYPDVIDGRSCLHLRGNVRLENNGGFIQAALDIQGTDASNASSYKGLVLDVYGNDEQYNLHLRTDDVWLPWQSYRISFMAPARWQSVKLPFKDFSGYRIWKDLDLRELERIGIVAIGREFTADLCIARLALYRDTE